MKNVLLKWSLCALKKKGIQYPTDSMFQVTSLYNSQGLLHVKYGLPTLSPLPQRFIQWFEPCNMFVCPQTRRWDNEMLCNHNGLHIECEYNHGQLGDGWSMHRWWIIICVESTCTCMKYLGIMNKHFQHYCRFIIL